MADSNRLPRKYQKRVEDLTSHLVNRLGVNLNTLILYGSAVRGGFIPGVSDLNILIILKSSTPDSHKAISEVMTSNQGFEPFVLACEGIDRSYRAFALKFQSIKRDYQLLHGEDALAELALDAELCGFLCEQALRNIRLRCVQAFIHHRSQPTKYHHFIVAIISQLFIDLSSVLRLKQVEIPAIFNDRLPVFSQHFRTDVSVLKELLNLKEHPRKLVSDEIESIHRRLLKLLNHVLDSVIANE